MSSYVIKKDILNILIIAVIFGVFEISISGARAIPVVILAAAGLFLLCFLIRWLFFRGNFSGCQVDDSFIGDVFEYKGKKYNKTKFVDNVLTGIRGSSDKKIKCTLNGKFFGENKFPEFGAVIRTAYEQALREFEKK